MGHMRGRVCACVCRCTRGRMLMRVHVCVCVCSFFGAGGRRRLTRWLMRVVDAGSPGQQQGRVRLLPGHACLACALRPAPCRPPTHPCPPARPPCPRPAPARSLPPHPPGHHHPHPHRPPGHHGPPHGARQHRHPLAVPCVRQPYKRHAQPQGTGGRADGRSQAPGPAWALPAGQARCWGPTAVPRSRPPHPRPTACFLGGWGWGAGEGLKWGGTGQGLKCAKGKEWGVRLVGWRRRRGWQVNARAFLAMPSRQQWLLDPSCPWYVCI